MAIQSNFPAIRPSLLLDFANSKRLDPRITFTRASTARYRDGVTVAKAEENLLLRSQDYSATWTVTNLTPVTGKTAPDNTSTATEFTAGAANATLTQSVTAIAADYTFSVWLRRVTGTGNIDISAHSGGTWVTQVISGTWARYTVTQTLTAGARTPGIRVVTSGDAIEVWGAQLEQRSAATFYTATTTAPITNYVPQLLTAAVDVPRFDHDPITGESLGLMREGARTNLVEYSQEFDNAYWTKTNSSILTAQNVAPDGTLTAQVYDEGTAASVSHGLTRALGLLNGSFYAVTVYAKNITGRYLVIAARRTSSGTMTSYFDLVNATSTLAALGSSITSGGRTITNVGNGWYRCEARFGFSSSVTSPSVSIGMWDGASSTISTSTGLYEYTGTGRQMFIWGAQVESTGAASVRGSSYIATSGATGTRSAESISLSGTNFSSWYDAAEGTLYYEGEVSFNGTATDRVVSVNDNTANNLIGFSYGATNATAPNAIVITSGATQADIALTPTSSPGQFFRAAMAYKVNDIAASKAGETVDTDTSASIPVVDRLSFAANQRVKKLAYYPLRLSDSQLQAITG